MRIQITDYQKAAIFNPWKHFCFYGGVGAGKSATGGIFSMIQMRLHPNLSGFIGANTYDQLSQVTLREFFKWMSEAGIEYIVDRRPPDAWGTRRKFKDYKNIVSVRMKGYTIPVFTRTLSDPDAIRGMEFSWYWIDELRDTKEYAHDMILGRMRESDHQKGLATTTTNGEEWDYRRFYKSQSNEFGSMHVPTIKSVEAGIIPRSYYNTLRGTYSELMARQELDAEHVNINSGRAYHSSGPWNRRSVAPWGDRVPNRNRPLIVACDFNFAPSPCVWVVGQLGPATAGPNGEDWFRHIHWFKEFAMTETGTRSMTRAIIQSYPDFITYRVFGDMSGNQGTTSNAGETDYNQMGDEFAKANMVAVIDALQLEDEDTKRNPLVKDRVEATNAVLRNAMGEVRMTYDPNQCPLLDTDMKMVGWKNISGQRGRGKLDDGGDKNRTHASDGVGYAIYRLFPPMKRSAPILTMPSAMRGDLNVLDI